MRWYLWVWPFFFFGVCTPSFCVLLFLAVDLGMNKFHFTGGRYANVTAYRCCLVIVCVCVQGHLHPTVEFQCDLPTPPVIIIIIIITHIVIFSMITEISSGCGTHARTIHASKHTHTQKQRKMYFQLRIHTQRYIFTDQKRLIRKSNILSHQATSNNCE